MAKNTVILLACSASKLPEAKSHPDKKYKAEDIYIGQLFQKSKRFAELQYNISKEDNKNLYILSALHHILRRDELISYYNKYLGDLNKKELKEWGTQVIEKLLKFRNIDDDIQGTGGAESLVEDEYIALAGKKYYEPISSGKYIKGKGTQNKKIEILSTPLSQYRGIGYQLGWLSSEIKRLENSKSILGKLKNTWSDLTSPPIGGEDYHKGTLKRSTDKELIEEYTKKFIEYCTLEGTGKNVKKVYPLGVKQNKSLKPLEIYIKGNVVLDSGKIKELIKNLPIKLTDKIEDLVTIKPDKIYKTYNVKFI